MLVNISETIAGDRSNRFGLLTEHKFCRKLSRSISIDSRYCNRFINLGRPIFPLNHSGASVATVFTTPTTFGIAHARCYTRAEQATQSAIRVGSSQLDSLTVLWTHYVPKIVFAFSPICVACTNSITIYLIIMKDFIFFSASARTSNPPFLLVGCDSWWQQAAEPASWLRNDLSIPHAPENMSHKNIITIYFHIWTLYNPIIGIFRACHGISIKTLIYGRQRRHRHLISPTRHRCTTHSEMRYLQV